MHRSTCQSDNVHACDRRSWLFWSAKLCLSSVTLGDLAAPEALIEVENGKKESSALIGSWLEVKK